MSEDTNSTPALGASAANPAGVVAVTDQMEAAGAIVYCRTRGGIPLFELEQEWNKRGLDPNLLPSGRTEEDALRRALMDVKQGGRELVRPLAGSNGLALVDEDARDNDLEYDVILRARVAYPPHQDPEAVVEPASHPRAATVKANFAEHLLKLSNAKISQWVWGRLGAHVKTVSLRETGGVYFVPRTTLPTWQAMTNAVSVVSDVRFYEIPAMESDDAVEAILDAVQAEADTVLSQMAEDLSKTGDEALGTRALKTRENKARELRDKVEQYQKLLGKTLEGFAERMDELEADIAGAILMQMGD